MRSIILFVIAMFVTNVNSASFFYCPEYYGISWQKRVGLKNGDELAFECEQPMVRFCLNQVYENLQHVLSLCPEYFLIPNCTFECIKSYFIFNCDCLLREVDRRKMPISYAYDSMFKFNVA